MHSTACFVLALFISAAHPSSFAAQYHVASDGDDRNPGTAPAQAWKTTDKVNSFRFQPGDQILFKGGDRFNGSVQLTGEDTGTESMPVEISSYGAGRASIIAGKQTGISATDVENLIIKNLIVIGDGPSVNQSYGALVENTHTNRMLKGVLIDSVEVQGFGKHGIFVTGKTYGYENVMVQRSAMHQNLRGGLEIAGKLPWDAKYYAHKNVTVSECRAYNNTGDPAFTQNHSGSGLVLYQVDGGRIEKSSAWNNGAACPAAGGGPVGIWTCASRRVVIEYCESFGNRTKGLDGGGFDIDGGSEECVLQYNYSHDNDGPGLMVYTYPYASHRDQNNIVRFNISVNDAIKSERYAGLWVRADGQKMRGVQIHNNTVITSGRHAAFIHADGVEALLRNNIFVSETAGVPFRIDTLSSNSIVSLQDNLYWRAGAPFLVRWGDKEMTSLDQLRAEVKQEIIGNERLGLFIDPGIELKSGGLMNPLPNLRVLVQFKPTIELSRNRTRTLAGPIAEPMRDFLGVEIQPGRPSPLGAISGL